MNGNVFYLIDVELNFKYYIASDIQLVTSTNYQYRSLKINIYFFLIRLKFYTDPKLTCLRCIGYFSHISYNTVCFWEFYFWWANRNFGPTFIILYNERNSLWGSFFFCMRIIRKGTKWSQNLLFNNISRKSEKETWYFD